MTKRTPIFNFLFIFHTSVFFPGKGAKYDHFGVDYFFSAVGPCRVMREQKNKSFNSENAKD